MRRGVHSHSGRSLTNFPCASAASQKVAVTRITPSPALTASSRMPALPLRMRGLRTSISTPPPGPLKSPCASSLPASSANACRSLGVESSGYSAINAGEAKMPRSSEQTRRVTTVDDAKLCSMAENTTSYCRSSSGARACSTSPMHGGAGAARPGALLRAGASDAGHSGVRRRSAGPSLAFRMVLGAFEDPGDRGGRARKRGLLDRPCTQRPEPVRARHTKHLEGARAPRARGAFLVP